MRFFAALAALVMFLSGECFPRVAPTTLQKLTASSKLIVIGKVTSVRDVKGLKVAEVRVTKTLKGAPQEVVYYLAQPTWTCDITGATVGVETLFFFEKYRFDPDPASVAFIKSAGGAGSYTVEDGATPAGAFKEPIGFRQAITAVVGSSPFWQVSWSGRGQMPLRNVGDTKHVTLWTGDVRLPAEMSTISGPQRNYSGFIRSVPLSQMLSFIQGPHVIESVPIGRVQHIAQSVRYFKAEHGVGATYVRLGADGSYKVIDREHMGIFLTDEGHWKQTGAVITFTPKDPKKSPYQATENEHNGKTFLAITSADAAAGIVIAADDIAKDLDADPNHLPDHVLFKISTKTYQTETKQTYPFRNIGRQH